jgi:cytoskeletal protein CcmA (bactofilin family)
MFSSKQAAATGPNGEQFKTLIDEGAVVEGQLKFSGGVRIDGKVIGDVTIDPAGKCTLAVGASAVIRGDVYSYRVLVSGQVDGNIHALERIELTESARVNGDVTYGSISISHGAKVSGRLIDGNLKTLEELPSAEGPALLGRPLEAVGRR